MKFLSIFIQQNLIDFEISHRKYFPGWYFIQSCLVDNFSWKFFGLWPIFWIKVQNNFVYTRFLIDFNFQLDEFSNRIASIFVTAKYARGESVALMMYNKPEYVAIWLGLAKLGVVTALINTNLRMESLVHCIKIANVRGIIFDAELAEGTIQLFFHLLFFDELGFIIKI